MKKTLALVLAAVMLLSLLSACKSSADETPTVDPAETEQTTTPEETTPEEETPEEETQPSQEELDQAAADEVAAMIDAIYVQERTDDTDAQCEAAKAAWDALTDAQKEEYLAIIEEESLRLAAMATNVMNLTKVENQTILTDLTTFNLSEQIRACVLLLEEKWSRKELDLDLEFPEYTIRANEELLKQVWINLLDNAIKYSPNYGEIGVRISEGPETLAVTITNYGPDIPKDKVSRIWGKFYQADESHSSEGNGIGLAVVKQVVQLHGGTATVDSGSGSTTFTVELPKQEETV